MRVGRIRSNISFTIFYRFCRAYIATEIIVQHNIPHSRSARILYLCQRNMKKHLTIWLFIFGLVSGMGASRILACGSGKCNMEQTASRHGHKSASCCSKAQACGHEKRDNPTCPVKNDCGGCPCSGFCSFSTFSGGLPAEFLPNLTGFQLVKSKRQAFYFDEHSPEAVYLPIWQPPKL